jgi:hypothetical protein
VLAQELGCAALAGPAVVAIEQAGRWLCREVLGSNLEPGKFAERMREELARYTAQARKQK